MLLTPAQLADLANEIRLQWLGYTVQALGIDAAGITQEQYQQLIDGGYVQPQEVEDFVLMAYRAGHAAAWTETQAGHVPGDKIRALYEDALKRGMPPLSKPQERAVEFAKQKAGQHCLGLGNRIAHDFTTLAIETEAGVRAEMKGLIAEAVATSVINRETARKLASRIGDATGDWSRNLQRIAETELQNAHLNGWADYIEDSVGANAQVGKRVNAEACPPCRRLYLDGDGHPKVFSLADLRDNGTNFGRKQKDWLPVVGTTHPRCFCQLIHIPGGFGFNKIGQMLPLAAIRREEGTA